MSVSVVAATVQAEEAAARAQMELDDDQGVNPGIKKTPSEASFASAELHIPRRRGDGGSGGDMGGGQGFTVDRECLSMKSDCGMDNRRRFSIVNGTGKKVPFQTLSVFVKILTPAVSTSKTLKQQLSK